ncbi:MAG: class I SAM-dependent methyltransferase [Candidatus Acidiferrales bacterium]
MTKQSPNRSRAREIAADFIRRGDPTGWFEALYREAESGTAEVPWADLRPNRNLLDFWCAHPLQIGGKSALAVGCGLGDDAEQLAAWGYHTTAFDISPAAIKAARERFPATAVDYITADLFAAPADWKQNFDFVVEIYTLQVLPAKLRPQAVHKIAEFLRRSGVLLAIARGRDTADPEGEMPWPLMREQFDEFTRAGLKEISFEDYCDPEDPSVRRFRAAYTRL